MSLVTALAEIVEWRRAPYACSMQTRKYRLGELRAELTAAGVFDHATGAALGKFALMLAALAALLTAAALTSWWWSLALIPLAAVPAATAAMVGHEAAHGSFSRSRRKNDLMLNLAFPLLTGLGALHWKNKHNVLHHGHPNVAGTDTDINVWPMAITRAEHERSGLVRRRLQRHLQRYLFWPLSGLLAFNMRVDSVTYLVRHARHRGIDRAWIADASFQVGHYALWLLLPSLIFGFVPTLLTYLGLWSVVGILLTLVFVPAHMGMPIVASKAADGWLHQLEATRNLVLPRWASYFFVGLDYQVEHHLFPRIPHPHLPRASRILRDWCVREGLPHHTVAYGKALADVDELLRGGWVEEPRAVAVAAD
jgi:fatty acid desaturase